MSPAINKAAPQGAAFASATQGYVGADAVQITTTLVPSLTLL